MPGYKNFGNETLQATEVNEYLMRQVVVRVADAAELASITSPEAGMMAYREDNGTTYRHNGTTWVAIHAADIAPETPGFTGIGSNASNIQRAGLMVSIDVSIQPGSAANGATIGTLDARFHPRGITTYVTLQGNSNSTNSAWLAISPSGVVTLFHYNTTSTTYLRGGRSYPVNVV